MRVCIQPLMNQPDIKLLASDSLLSRDKGYRHKQPYLQTAQTQEHDTI